MPWDTGDDDSGAGGGYNWPSGAWANAPVWKGMVEAALAAGQTANSMAALIQMGMRGFTDAEIDDYVNKQQGGGEQNTANLPGWWSQASDAQRANYIANQTRTTGGGSTALSDFDVQWGAMSPEQRQQYLSQMVGGTTPWQQQQWQASQDAAQRAYDLQNRQFAWQQQEAARAREEARLQRATEQGSRPRDWATLWQMYGGEKGLPQGYTPPALEPEVQIPSWTAALQAAPQVQAPAGGYAVPTTTPLPSILRGAIEGRAAPTGGMFRMPEGAGVLPSAQYLGELPGTALEGLAGVYGKEFGLSWDDIVQAVQRSLPRKSATASTSLMALGR